MKKNVMKVVGGIVLSVGILAGCGTASPKDTVNSFTSAYQKDDIKTAFTFVNGSVNKVTQSSGMDIKDSNKVIQDILKAEASGFKVNSIKEVSSKGDTAKVKVDFTGKDFGQSAVKAVGQVMPTAFATAFAGGDKAQSQKALQDMMFKDIIQNLNAKDAPTIEKKVTLTLKKDKDGKYLIKPDKEFEQVILPNYDQLDKLFNSQPTSQSQSSQTDQWGADQASADQATADQPAQTVSVVKTIATNKAVNMNPVQVTLDDISIKKADNVSQDEIDRINGLGYNVTGTSFNYLSIKYTAKNTSPKNIDFGGISKVVIISGNQQEVVDSYDKQSIVSDDPNADAVFYGQVTKQGNNGYIFTTDPSKITKIIVTVSHSMEDKTYDGGTDDTDITFTP
jgi:hypothetical protein